jgi:hypothetical protein
VVSHPYVTNFLTAKARKAKKKGKTEGFGPSRPQANMFFMSKPEKRPETFIGFPVGVKKGGLRPYVFHSVR